MLISPTVLVLLGSLGLDYLLGDPWTWYHPVQAMGALINGGKRIILHAGSRPWQQRLGGGILTIGLGLGSYGYAWALIAVASGIHVWLGTALHIVLLASCLGGRSLRRAAEEVLQPLEQGDLEVARHQLSRYVGRDTDSLNTVEICRALVETVAENTPDGATAPLFFALLGGAPLAFAYKAVSTLDSMVGYRRDPYTYLGTLPARTEDVLTWIPARLTVLSLALMQPNPIAFWRACRRDALADPSPNSGWSEAAFAHTLGIQLGGLNHYQGIPTLKPLLGTPGRPLDPVVVRDSLHLLRRVLLIWVGAGVGIRLGFELWG
ncbi:MAG: cobalamin biosynthesis protein CobD [Synechococcaceae cyanobacterium SM2_3_2]|nr:cobalamin biosynthesis protein CobD [Synechococcaceae cyanobacterium SM2_3_2]